MNIILSTLWFYLPAFAANVAPYFIYKQHSIDIPLDLNHKIKGMPLIGNRSMGGFFSSLLAGLIIGTLQQRAYEGLVMGIGVFVAVTLNSFIKRRMKMKKGQNFMPADQIDFILGASAAYLTIAPISPQKFLTGIILGFAIHLIVNLLFRRNVLIKRR